MEIAIRSAELGDHPAFVTLFGELGVPDPVPGAQAFAAHLMPNMIVAEADHGIVGYAIWRIYGPTTHVLNVVVDPGWRGRRIGQLLLERVRDVAKAAGSVRWYLNVKADNMPAIRLYERCGFEIDAETFALVIPWSAALSLPFEEALENRTVEPDEDGLVARALDLEPERLAALRAGKDAVLVSVGAPERPVAFAAFTPGYPKAHPFRALRPALAGNLLRACHVHADQTTCDFVRVTVEGDRPLYESLVARGATLTFALFRMASAL